MNNYEMPLNSTSSPTNVLSSQCLKEEAPSYIFFGIEFAVSPFEVILTIFLLGFVILLTIIGNILVILSVFMHRPLRIVQNFFIVSLAVADLTVAILVLPLNVAYSILGKWVFGKYICKMWLTSDVLCCTASIFNLCAIAVDRYWAITDPINYACKRTLKRVIIMIVVTWVLSAIISSPPLIGWNDWPEVFHSDTPCKLTSEKGYVVYSATGSFFFPLFTMTAVYLEIFRATRRRLRERAKASKLNALKNNDEKVVMEQSVLEHESISSELNHEGNRNSFRKWTSFPKKEKKTRQGREKKIHKEKKINKGKEKSSQNSLLVPKRQTDESLSDTMGKGGPSSEEADVITPVDANNDNITISTNGATPVIHHSNLTRKCTFVHQFIEEKQKISLNKERKAARTLGIIMGVFVICWLPFFLMYVTLAFCENCCLSNRTINIVTWLGYINSALNPIIYTIFNMDFRKAFRKLLHLKTTN